MAEVILQEGFGLLTKMIRGMPRPYGLALRGVDERDSELWRWAATQGMGRWGTDRQLSVETVVSPMSTGIGAG